MPFLVNGPRDSDNETLLECLDRNIKETTGQHGKRGFYGLTCYFDKRSILEIATHVNDSLKQSGGTLTDFVVVVDAGDWIKQRVTIEKIVCEINKIIKIDPKKIRFIPVNTPNQLLHAKGYGIISEVNKANERKGFVIITSANMTRMGIGYSKESNIELAEIITEASCLNDFFDTLEYLKQYEISTKTTKKQRDFLTMLAIFGSGCFYHKWDANLSGPVRFKLTLTEKGRKAIQSGAIYPEYNNDSETISRDPLNLQNIFKNEETRKLFPQSFWKTYSIDTIL